MTDGAAFQDKFYCKYRTVYTAAKSAQNIQSSGDGLQSILNPRNTLNSTDIQLTTIVYSNL